MSKLKEDAEHVVLPVPEPSDLPPFFKWRGWYASENPETPGWTAHLQREHPMFPPVGQWIFLPLERVIALKPAARIKLITSEINRIIEETNMTLRRLGWDVKHGYEAPKVKKEDYL